MFIVEDGTGIPGANAFVDVDYVSDYLIGGDKTAFDTLSLDQQQTSIIKASRFISSTFDWKGTRKTVEQGLAWPRVNVKFEGFPMIGIPEALKAATAEGTALAVSGAELSSTSSGKSVSSMTEGDHSISYSSSSATAVNTSKYDILNGLLKGLYDEINTSGVIVGGSVGGTRVERT
jgi:hypothetical protein